ncbi:FNIP repeat-containing protein [Acanthamoeba polyphaga moumouvirus]|uniref:FNIP repeat-containing protein n=1 Tax=Acanthamoeba polyphaga moumouvirus TaxID=1269028 RepID=L7RD41_9VIRU|nr:FNIP repeat-containing protein [Acanthamoeba polyphaga moumouvirus]AGC02186.1 FNIP repeat-containing protein [Acanthamoeba polyphaga moumouvirus]
MNIIDTFDENILNLIIKLLDDKSKILFISTCQKTRTFLKNPCCTFTFDDIYEYKKIKQLDYLNKFSKIKYIVNNNDKIPDCITHLEYNIEFFQPSIKCIPNSVTHLEFGFDFNESIKECVPENITHLIFGDQFNKPINECMHENILYLKFGDEFNKPIKGCIPINIEYLIFGWEFNQPIKECIPNGLTHLEFGFFLIRHSMAVYLIV